MTIHLVLTYYWFDEIIAGRKNIEYRKMTKYWKKRIWDNRNYINRVRFSRGYTNKYIFRRVLGIDIGTCPYDGWDSEYYRLHFKPTDLIKE